MEAELTLVVPDPGLHKLLQGSGDRTSYVVSMFSIKLHLT